MKVAEKIRNFIVTLRELPEPTKKLILFSVVGFFALILGFFWVRSTAYNISKIGASVASIQLPKIDMSGAGPNPLSSVADLTDNANVKAVGDALDSQANQASSTDDWQTYQSDAYGFSVEYPPGFFGASKESLNKEVVLWQSFASNQFQHAPAGYSTLDVQVVATHLAPDAWIGDNFKDGALAVKPEDVQEITLGDGSTQAFQFSVKGKAITYQYTVFSSGNGNLFVLSYHQANNTDVSLYPADIYQTFLSTFQFTNNN